MSTGRTLDDIVTEFLLNTCRPCPSSRSKYAVQAALQCCIAASARLDNDTELALISLTTGSVAEFYIEPILPHVSDIDVMGHRNDELAIPRGHLPPRQLPAEFYNYVTVVEIIDSPFPGYVTLELGYVLTQSSHHDNYNAVECDGELYRSRIYLKRR